MENLRKIDIENVTSIIQKVYLSDTIPWICGYSGRKRLNSNRAAGMECVISASKGKAKEKSPYYKYGYISRIPGCFVMGKRIPTENGAGIQGEAEWNNCCSSVKTSGRRFLLGKSDWKRLCLSPSKVPLVYGKDENCAFQSVYTGHTES